jgi:hypothetical protein
MAGVHHQHRRLVIRDVGVHRPNHADIVRAAAHVREQLAHFQAALPVPGEREGRLHQRAGLALGRHGTTRKRLPVVLVEHRFRIEAVDLRQATVHEQENDGLGLRRVVQAP